MSVVVNEVRRGSYLDSVALMRIAETVKAVPGVEECGLMMGTPANRRIMAEAGVLAAEGEAAGPADLVIALRAADAAAADAAFAVARAALDKPRIASSGQATWSPRSLDAAAAGLPGANLVLVSVPGAFAAGEAMKALRRGLNVMLFSDNVSIADEARLKQEAARRGLLVMGPDCGTAIIAGVPLAFANVVPRGDIGIIGASGTGIQEVSCLIARAGGGISHAIGTGGRDLKAEVGGLTTLAAIDVLDADPGTRTIVIISKPPAPEVAARVLERVSRSNKSFGICFMGGTEHAMPANAKAARTLRGVADIAMGQQLPRHHSRGSDQRGRLIRGLFCGGTLCAEAQVVLLRAGARVASNAPVLGAVSPLVPEVHQMLDLGDDEYTQGRPHPMIEPVVRSASLEAALRDESVGVVLIDVVLGHGSHHEPAAEVARVVERVGSHDKTLLASICGTHADPQNMGRQEQILMKAGFLVFGSMSDAAETAAKTVRLGK